MLHKINIICRVKYVEHKTKQKGRQFHQNILKLDRWPKLHRKFVNKETRALFYSWSLRVLSYGCGRIAVLLDHARKSPTKKRKR